MRNVSGDKATDLDVKQWHTCVLGRRLQDDHGLDVSPRACRPVGRGRSRITDACAGRCRPMLASPTWFPWCISKVLSTRL